MSEDLAFTIPVADFFAAGVIGLLAFNGFRRGVLGAFFTLLRIYLTFIITALSYERAALPFQARLSASTSTSQIFCFITIFVLVFAAAWAVEIVLRRKISESPGGRKKPSRIGGIILGLFQGILLLSILYMNVDFFPASDRGGTSRLEDAFSHKLVRHVAPGIKDLSVDSVSYFRTLSGRQKPPESEDSPL